MFGLSDGEEIMTKSLRFDTVPECDRQTDGRTLLMAIWAYQRLHSLLCYRTGNNEEEEDLINSAKPILINFN